MEKAIYLTMKGRETLDGDCDTEILGPAVHSRDIVGWDVPLSNVWSVPVESGAVG